jgi:hypothetical protein
MPSPRLHAPDATFPLFERAELGSQKMEGSACSENGALSSMQAKILRWASLPSERFLARWKQETGLWVINQALDITNPSSAPLKLLLPPIFLINSN